MSVFSQSPSSLPGSFTYNIQDVTTPYSVRCCYTDSDTIKTALDKCPFFSKVYGWSVCPMRITMGCNTEWLPDNFPCNLMCDAWGDITLVCTSTPQPEYPVRQVRAPNDVFIVKIYVGPGYKGRHLLNVKRTARTPGFLLLVVDPWKTIRESLKDDGRFSSQVLEGQYPHLKASYKNNTTLIPVDQLGQALQRDALWYKIHIKPPGCFLRKSKLRSLFKGVPN